MAKAVELWDKENNVKLSVVDGVLSVNTAEHLTTFTQEYTADGSGNVAEAVIVAGIAGKHFGVQSVFIATDGASGSMAIDFATSTLKIMRTYPTKNTQSVGASTHIEGATAEGISLTITGIGAGKKVFVSISYMIHTS